MAKVVGDKSTLDMFNGDVAAVPKFEKEKVRASSLGGQISRAVADVLRTATDREGKPLSREEVAERMSDYLGEEEAVSVNMLNAYASQAREGHHISLVRLCALMHATDDYRPLQMMSGFFELSVIPRKYEMALDWVRLVSEREKIDEELDYVKRAFSA